jgi:hypothetical protein
MHDDLDYTPSPWCLYFDRHNLDYTIRGLSRESLPIGIQQPTTMKRLYMDICYGALEEPTAEVAGNMQLITAAPDLYEACLTALDELKRVSDNEIVIKKLEKALDRTNLVPIIEVSDEY